MLVLAAGISSGTVGISSGEYGCSASSSVSFITMALQVHDEGNTICVINCISLSLSIRRLFLYSILIFAGMIPVTHWAVTNGGLTSPLVMVSISLLVQCYLVLLILPPVMISLFL